MPKIVCQKVVAIDIHQCISAFSVCDRMRPPKCFSVIRQENVREVSRTRSVICICTPSPSISREHPLVMREFPWLLFILWVRSLMLLHHDILFFLHSFQVTAALVSGFGILCYYLWSRKVSLLS